MGRSFKYFIGILVFIAVSSCKKDSFDELQHSELQTYKEQLYDNDDFMSVLSTLEHSYEEEQRSLAAMERLSFLESAERLADGEGFVFFVIGDTELDMRGNTFDQLQNLLEAINNVEALNLTFPSGDFEVGESNAITKPELLFLAGDINKDRAYGFLSETAPATDRLFKTLDDDILFFPGNGNHDWDPYQFGDGSYGMNLGGLISNLGTANFVRKNYQASLKKACCVADQSFNYDRNATFFPLTSTAEFNYSFEYKGVQFTNLNTFLQNPISMMSIESLFGQGPAWYFENKTKSWLSQICASSKADMKPHVLVQHYPINSFSASSWWNDYGVSGTENLRKEFMDIFSTAHLPVMFSGHNHSFSTTRVLPYDIFDHTSGYFAQQNAVIAVKANATKGVYAMAYIDILNGTVRDPYATIRTFSVE